MAIVLLLLFISGFMHFKMTSSEISEDLVYHITCPVQYLEAMGIPFIQVQLV